jgi:hypothetical protein
LKGRRRQERRRVGVAGTRPHITLESDPLRIASHACPPSTPVC